MESDFYISLFQTHHHTVGRRVNDGTRRDSLCFMFKREVPYGKAACHMY